MAQHLDRQDIMEAEAIKYAKEQEQLERSLLQSNLERSRGGKKPRMVHTRPKPFASKPFASKPFASKPFASKPSTTNTTKKACEKAVAAWMLPAVEPATKLASKHSSNPKGRPKPSMSHRV
jgi:hypothetical protein